MYNSQSQYCSAEVSEEVHCLTLLVTQSWSKHPTAISTKYIASWSKRLLQKSKHPPWNSINKVRSSDHRGSQIFHHADWRDVLTIGHSSSYPLDTLTNHPTTTDANQQLDTLTGNTFSIGRADYSSLATLVLWRWWGHILGASRPVRASNLDSFAIVVKFLPSNNVLQSIRDIGRNNLLKQELNWWLYKSWADPCRGGGGGGGGGQGVWTHDVSFLRLSQKFSL